MSPEIIGAIGLATMLALMFIGIPVGYCMALLGVVGYAILSTPAKSLSMAAMMPYSTIAGYVLSVLPVFLLMGEFADVSGMMKDAYRAANTWLGSLPGGLAMASIMGAALFSAVSGSSMACAAIMTRISLPSLLEYKYHPRLATGALAAGGTLGNLIPPGIAFVFYALMSETSIGKLFTAALIPGIVLTFMYIIQIYIQCKINPKLGPPVGATTFKQKIVAFKYTWALLLLFLIVMGGIWLGIFTATEAGAIGAVGGFVYALIRRTLTWSNFVGCLKNTAKICGMGFLVIVGAQLFTNFVTLSGLSQALADWVVSLNFSATGIIIAIMVVYFILGTAMDTMSMILLTLPIFLGVCIAMDIDLIWFGVLVIIQMELASLSPPAGLNLYVVSAMVRDKGISMGTIYVGVIPFCATMLVFNAVIIAFPQIALFLPNLMKG